MSNISVLPCALSISVCSSLFKKIRLSLFWIFLSIGPELFYWAHPKDSSFELKSPTNMTLSERLLMVWKSEELGFPFGQ